jgi:hypothetical protein
MKKSIRLFIVTLITFGFFYAPAKAASYSPEYGYSRVGGNNHGSQGYNDHRTGGSYSGFNMNQNTPASPSTNLPVNGGIVFLMIAGLTIGVVSISRFKKLKPVMVAAK